MNIHKYLHFDLKHPIILFGCVFIVLYFVVLNPLHLYSVKVSVDTFDSKTNIVKVYYRGDKKGWYSEKNTSYNKSLGWIDIPIYKNILRFDPLTRKASFKIDSFIIKKRSFLKTEYIKFDQSKIRAFFKYDNLVLSNENQDLWESKTIDPYFYDFRMPSNFMEFAEKNSLIYSHTSNFSFLLLCLLISFTAYLLFVFLKRFFLDSQNLNLYIFAYIFFLFFGSIFSIYTPRSLPPDELAHLSYIHYMSKSDRLYPEKENMHIEYDKSRPLNYLSHPPMYYYILSSLSKGFDNEFEASSYFLILRLINTILFSISLLLIFSVVINFKWEKETHLLFVTLLFTVPSFIIFCNTVNNDNLGILSGALALFSVFYHRKKGDILYLQLILLAVSLAFFSKLTVAIMVCVFAVLYYLSYRKYFFRKSEIVNVLKNPLSYLMLFLLFFSLSFYVYYAVKYGTIIPSVNAIDPEAFKSSIWFIPTEERNILTIFQYAHSFLRSLWRSSNGILGHGSLLAIFSCYYGLGFLMLMGSSSFFFTSKNFKEKDNVFVMLGMVTLVIFMGIHFVKGYSSYKQSGYSGGVQARYYFPFVFVYVSAFCFQVNSLLCFIKKKYFVWYQKVKLIVVGLCAYAFYLYFKVICYFIKACL